MTPEGPLVERWRALLTSYNEVASQLERALQEGHGLTMGEFETLDRLVAVPYDECRMQDLSADMYLSQSALSRTVARLEKSGLVARALCEADRRGVFVKVTESGRQRYAEAQPTHAAVLAQCLRPEPGRP